MAALKVFAKGGSGCYTAEEFSLITEEQLVVVMSLDSHGMKSPLKKTSICHKL